MIYRSEQGDIRLFLAGDAMPARGLKDFDEPQYRALVDLCRGADAVPGRRSTRGSGAWNSRW